MILSPERNRAVEAALAALLVVLLAVVWWIAATLASETERDAAAAAMLEMRQISRLIAEEWQARLARIDWLQHLASHVNDDPGSRASVSLDELRAEAGAYGNDVVQVAAMDARGTITWSTLTLPATPVSLAGREHYRAIALDGRDSFVGRPVRGAVSGRWTIQFARAIRDPDRTLRGITVVSVDEDILKPLANELDDPAHGIVTIIRSDGVVLARSREYDGDQFLDVTTPVLATALRSGVGEGEIVSQIDKVRRFVVARRIANSDMLVEVGADVEAKLASARRVAVGIRQSAAAGSVGLVLVFAGLVVARRRHLAMQETERRLGELAQQELFLQQIAEEATDVIALHDATTAVICINPAVRAMFGLDPDLVIATGECPWSTSPDREGIVDVAISGLLQQGGVERFEFRAAQASWFETEMVAVAAPHGQSRSGRFISITRDITARRHAEQELVEAHQRLDNLLTLSPGVLYRLSFGEDGMTRREFAALRPLLGYPPEETAKPEHLERLLDREHRDRLEAAIQTCLTTGLALVEYPAPDRDGALRWVRDEMRLVAGDPMAPAIVGYMTDITSEVETRARLEHAEHLARLGQTVGNIGHEINQPLATIALTAENTLRLVTKGDAAPEVVAAKLASMRDQAHHISAVIAEIRSLTRIDRRRPEPVDLADTIANAVVLTESRLLAAGVSVDCDIPPDLLPVHAVRAPLQQVLVNLISNACDAYRINGRGDRRIRIAARAEGTMVHVSVTDSAGGIPGPIRHRIFEPFVTTKSAGEGTGLGLAISLATITRFGGTLDVRNVDGGAVFDLRLKVASEEDHGAV